MLPSERHPRHDLGTTSAPRSRGHPWWRLRTEPDAWHALPKPSPAKPYVPAEAKALQGTRRQVTAWLDANGARMLAAADGFVWHVPFIGHVLFTSTAQEIRFGSVFPVGTYGSDGEPDEAWSWYRRIRWTGTAWETTGELPGYARLRDGPWRRVGPGLGSVGLSGPMIQPDARQSSVTSLYPAEVSAPTPLGFVQPFLTGAPVHACYADARHGGAWNDVERSLTLPRVPLPPVPSGADPGFGGRATLIATVAADGQTTDVTVEGAATARFSACISKTVPPAWYDPRIVRTKPARARTQSSPDITRATADRR